jgi:hypothetical protein
MPGGARTHPPREGVDRPREAYIGGMETSLAPPDLVKLLDAVCPVAPPVERGEQFGSRALFVNGHPIGGVHEEDMYIRLPPAELQTFLALPGAAPFAPSGHHVSSRYGVFPADMPMGERRQWFDRAVAYAQLLPPARR